MAYRAHARGRFPPPPMQKPPYGKWDFLFVRRNFFVVGLACYIIDYLFVYLCNISIWCIVIPVFVEINKQNNIDMYFVFQYIYVNLQICFFLVETCVPRSTSTSERKKIPNNK